MRMNLSATEKQRRFRAKKRSKLSTFPLPPKGEVRIEKELIQCHVCGFWCKALAPSHISIHGLTADDYREEFELNRGQKLCGEDTSEKLRKIFVDSGLVGKWGSVEQMRLGYSKVSGTPRRLQARLVQSKLKKGISVPTTTARIEAARKNCQKRIILRNCTRCGKEIMGQKDQNAYCKDCHPLHRQEYGLAYRTANAEKLRKYFRQYDAKRRGKRKKNT